MRKKILVIDDDVSSLELLEDRLKASGYDVITASDGEMGLAMAQDHKPDLVIMDILLPRMNGFQLCQRIKADPALASVPIMMLTAVYVDEVDKEKGLQVGAERYLMKADVYMSKPFLSDRLLDNVRVLLGERRPEELILKEKVLVIDDDPAILELLQVRLEAKGYEVITTLDGEKGLKMIASEKPNVVILDIQLPRMSGIDVLTKIREDKPHLPVVMITAYGSEKIAIESMRRGANDYITKPIDHKELSMRIRENLEKSRLRSELDRLIAMLKESNVRLMQQYEELKQTQEQLIRAEKLAAVGELGAGAAHELNNPLAAIIAYSEMHLRAMKKREPLRKDLENILEDALRCKRIVRNLLDYARREEPEISPTNINGLLDNKVIPLVERQITVTNVKIKRKYSPKMPEIMADPNLLQQAFINIMINAYQAMPKGGEITLTTKFLTEAQKIEIRITDTGEGVPKENLGRIFDPFFTTRPSGKGTGLGLSVTHSIIERHKGTIDVESEPGKGTTFIVRLPMGERIVKKKE